MRVITMWAESSWVWKDWSYGVRRYWGYVILVVWFFFLAMMSLPGNALGAEAPVLQKPGTLCAKGLKYDVVKVEGKWRALCYEGNVEAARFRVDADVAFPSSERTAAGCMTCSLEEDLMIEALWALREYNRR